MMRKVKVINDRRQPTQAEVEEQERTNHCPYRNWCGICVRARGKDMDHRADAGEERGDEGDAETGRKEREKRVKRYGKKS